MNFPVNYLVALPVLALTLIFSQSDVAAQCNGGGGRGNPTGSTGTISPGLLTSSSGLNNPLAMSLMRQRAQLAYQNSMRQRTIRSAREEQARATRLARAEATRAARSARAAARLAERDALQKNSGSEYMFASTRVKPQIE